MPRAIRYVLPGHVWHITHRCRRNAFLLRFARDRHRYLHWVFEAKTRYGLVVLNYAVTSNHIHLLVKDTGGGVIAQSMQLIAGRTAQEFNERKGHQGAFWEDRYHATAIEVDEHLARCVVYIDPNMVRAGVVKHPSESSRASCQRGRSSPTNGLVGFQLVNSSYVRPTDLIIRHCCYRQISSTPLVMCEFALPSGSAMRPSTTTGLFQWPPPESSVVTWRPLVAS